MNTILSTEADRIKNRAKRKLKYKSVPLTEKIIRRAARRCGYRVQAKPNFLHRQLTVFTGRSKATFYLKDNPHFKVEFALVGPTVPPGESEVFLSLQLGYSLQCGILLEGCSKLSPKLAKALWEIVGIEDARVDLSEPLWRMPAPIWIQDGVNGGDRVPASLVILTQSQAEQALSDLTKKCCFEIPPSKERKSKR